MAPRKNKKASADTEQFCVKMGLRKLNISRAHSLAMMDDIKCMSEIQSLTSILVEYGIRHPNGQLLHYLTTGKVMANEGAELRDEEQQQEKPYYGPNFEFIMRAFGGRTTKPFVNDLIEELDRIHPEPVMKRNYNLTNRSNLLKQCAVTFTTNFQNNIVVHAETRVYQYFVHCLGPDAEGKPQKAKAYQQKQLLFNVLEHRPNPDVLNTILQEPAYEHLDFTEFKNSWWKFIPFFLEVQRELKSFALTPIMKPGLKHVLYTKTVICEFINRVDGKLPQSMWPDQDRDKDALWARVITVPRKLRRNFDHSISTDGVAVSLTCKRVKKENNAEENIHYDENDHDCFVGWDPGKKCPLAGVRKNQMILNSEGQQYEEQRFLIKSKSFHYRAGFYTRERKRKRMTGIIYKFT